MYGKTVWSACSCRCTTITLDTNNKKTAKFVTAYKNDKLHGIIIEYTLKAYKNKHFILVT